MIISQFQETRQFLGRLDAGQDVIAALKTVCGENHVSCAWITACAVLSDVEVRPVTKDGFGDAVVIEGTAFCPAVNGNVSMNDEVVEVRLYAASLEHGPKKGPSAGLITSGEVRMFEFTLTSFEDATLVREDDGGFAQWQQLRTQADISAAGLAARHPMGPLSRPKPMPIYQSADEDEASELVIIEMKAGDFVDHPRFGVCKIVHAPVDDKLSIRLPTGKHVDLHLGVMRVLPAKQKGGRKVYQVEVKRKV